MQMYFGIPLAKPPVGNLRWKAPLDKLNDILQTKAFAGIAFMHGDKLSRWLKADPNATTPPVMIIDAVSKAGDAKDDAHYVF